MKTVKLTGFLINIKASGEYDRLLFVFSHERGLISVIAKGIRKMGSRRSFHIDLINAVRMEVEENHRASYLREITVRNAYAALKRQPERFAIACVIASFLLSVLPLGAPQKNLFFMTKKIFEKLNGEMQNGDRQRKELLLVYLLKATRELGYLPHAIPKRKLGKTLGEVLHDLNPQFTLRARRMLGIFESFKSTRSS